jgi:hypothetical protein
MTELKSLQFDIFHIQNRVEKGIVSAVGRPESILTKGQFYSYVDQHKHIVCLISLMMGQTEDDLGDND